MITLAQKMIGSDLMGKMSPASRAIRITHEGMFSYLRS